MSDDAINQTGTKQNEQQATKAATVVGEALDVAYPQAKPNPVIPGGTMCGKTAALMEYKPSVPPAKRAVLNRLAEKVIGATIWMVAPEHEEAFLAERPDDLPPFVDAVDLVTTPPPEPPMLVDGLLHQGSKLVIGGGSKSFKTWVLMDLALSVAHGLPWWGLPTVRCKVLYLNFEIQASFFTKRLTVIQQARQCKLETRQLTVQNLRGYAADFDRLLPEIAQRILDQGYGLIILDPIYKGLGNLNENDAGEMTQLMNKVEKLAVKTGAAVGFGAHFSKGNQAGKESIDRISGSGVFARDPDTILTMTKHKTEQAFTIDATLRNFKPMDPFCVKWEYPLMKRDNTLDPEDLKQAAGRKPKYSTDSVVKTLVGKELTRGEWLELCGIPKSSFDRWVKEAQDKGLVQQQGDKYRMVEQPPKSQNSQN